MVNRKHHCRYCGHIFCNKCCPTAGDAAGGGGGAGGRTRLGTMGKLTNLGRRATMSKTDDESLRVRRPTHFDEKNPR